MLWKRDWSFESLSSLRRVDMACCIIGVGLDSAVLCAVEPITDYCYRSRSDCSQGTNGCEDWGNSRNMTSVGVFLIEGLAKAFARSTTQN
ncbi:hypothetical protein CY35_02G005000 [Sphagnum magellanicum]|nr:hypothetical protein CY35_02G005000 [Sphagnum magellanicum]